MLPAIDLKDEAEARRCLRDIVALSTLPALWFGADRVRLTESLAAALFTTLGPDFVCALCVTDSAKPPVVVAQTGRYESSPELADRVAPLLMEWARTHDPDELLRLPNPRGSGELLVAVRPIGHMAEFGVLAAGFPSNSPPTATHQLLLNIAATQAGAAVQNARLVGSLQEEGRALETLNSVGAALAAEFNHDQVVQIVIDAAVKLTGAQFGAFFYKEVDETGGSFMLYRLSGADQSAFAGFPHPRNTMVFEPTFLGQGTVRSDDITQDPRYGKNAPHKGMPQGHLPVRSYLAASVRTRSGEVIGGLFFAHSEAGVFSTRSEKLVEALASQAAIAMDNARLLEAVQRANQTLEERVRERTSELEAAHEALRQAQKMEAIGQLTGGIAHDFNNLLTVIRGSVDLLRRPDLPEGRRLRYVEAIADTADRAAKLTGQLLAFARRQALTPQTFDAAARVRGIAEMLRTVLGARVLLEIEDGGPAFIRADPAQFETALVNMAVNARDAMDGEGRLTIRTTRLDPSASSPALTECPCVAIEVSDTGHGIAPDDLQRVFEPFFTTKEVGRGTGLGLSQVYGFTRQSGGRVEVRSEPGQGASFTMLLPSAADQEASEDVSPPDRSGAVCAARVLVVEDNTDVREFAERILADLGFRPTLASSAQEALDLLENDASRFDVIFSDVVMPGMGGVDFARQVRRRWPDLPIVLTSGYSHVLAEDTAHGFPLLHKPYSADGLTRVLRAAVSEGAGV
ncbi:ATP-binding protein [Phenylobacterium sp.]|uniref:ATP-binding protein n=1 Tax=Phenylobacterium sp. TaxID=1871053 RepID=UPI002810B0B6|nr:ATP-binding protein [Phenylobacterium sp.]